MIRSYLPTSLPLYLPTSLPPYLPTSLPPYLPTSLPPYFPTSLPPYLPTFLPSYFPTSLLAYMPTCLPTAYLKSMQVLESKQHHVKNLFYHRTNIFAVMIKHLSEMFKTFLWEMSYEIIFVIGNLN